MNDEDDDEIDLEAQKRLRPDPLRVDARSSPRKPADPAKHLARAATPIQAVPSPAPKPQEAPKPPGLSEQARREAYQRFRVQQGNVGCPQPEEMPDGWQPRPKRK